jgi:hypothetical protein
MPRIAASPISRALIAADLLLDGSEGEIRAAAKCAILTPIASSPARP